MLTNDERSAALELMLRLAKTPLAIKFVTTHGEVSVLPKTSFTPPSSCAFWTHGLRQPFTTEPDQHMNCNVGAYVHGLKSLDEISPGCGCEDIDLLLKTGRFEKEALANLPHIHFKPTQIVYAPLSKMIDEPDVVMLFVLPNQAQLLFEAAQKAGVHTVFRGMPTCAIIPTAMQTQSAVFGLGCTPSRLRAGYGSDEIIVALTPEALDRILEVLDKLVQTEKELIRYEQK